MKILIKNGHVIDPDTKLDQVADVLLEDDKIQEVSEREHQRRSRSGDRCQRLLRHARADRYACTSA